MSESMKYKLKALWQHFAGPKPVWVFVAGVALAAALGSIRNYQSPAAVGVTYTGYWLQVFGLIFVGLGLSKLRKQFGIEPIPTRVQKWFQRLVAILVGKPSNVVVAVATGVGGVGVAGSASATLTTRPASVEERLAALERELEHHRKEMNRRLDKQQGEIGDLQKSVATQARETRRLEREINATIKTVAVGWFEYELVGLGWLLLGVTATTIPDNLVYLVTSAWSFVVSYVLPTVWPSKT